MAQQATLRRYAQEESKAAVQGETDGAAYVPGLLRYGETKGQRINHAAYQFSLDIRPVRDARKCYQSAFRAAARKVNDVA